VFYLGSSGIEGKINSPTLVAMPSGPDPTLTLALSNWLPSLCELALVQDHLHVGLRAIKAIVIYLLGRPKAMPQAALPIISQQALGLCGIINRLLMEFISGTQAPDLSSPNITPKSCLAWEQSQPASPTRHLCAHYCSLQGKP
jgi:hypothetical protein